MRACEGCRRRKIKCDAASTNTWPCSACTRLKLQCIPPTVGNDRDFTGTGSFADSEGPIEYSVSSTLGPNALNIEPNPLQCYVEIPAQENHDQNAGYAQPINPYQLNSYSYPAEGLHQTYEDIHPAHFTDTNPVAHQSHSYYSPPQIRNNSTTSTTETDYSTAEDLSEALGDLKIGESGIGEWLLSALQTSSSFALQLHMSDSRKIMVQNQRALSTM